MAIAPKSLDPWILRIEQQVPGLSEIGFSSDLAAAIEGGQVTPAVYVLPAQERSVNVGHASGQKLHQLIESTVSVVMAYRHAADPRGEKAQDGLQQDIRTPLWAALIGWAPYDVGQLVRFNRGARLALRDSVLYWQDLFTVRYRIQN